MTHYVGYHGTTLENAEKFVEKGLYRLKGPLVRSGCLFL